MKGARCPKSWQVEAIRDGRLTGKLRIDAEQHAARCEVCQAEARGIELLSQALHDSAPRSDQMALRRLRNATLEEADSALRGSLRPVSRAPWRWAFALLSMAFGLIWAWKLHQSASASLGVQVHASNNAVWTHNESPTLHQIDLAEGMLSLTVTTDRRRTRFIVHVPDGEIEDIGTKFQVWVGAGRTRQITVSEGAVVFRRQSALAVVIRAGEGWVLPPASPPNRTPEAPVPLVPRPADPLTRARAGASLGAAGKAGRAGRANPPESDGATEEDLAYLHIVALQEEHRELEAQLAARDYLRRFAHGFRRIEVTRIASTRPGTANP